MLLLLFSLHLSLVAGGHLRGCLLPSSHTDSGSPAAVPLSSLSDPAPKPNSPSASPAPSASAHSPNPDPPAAVQKPNPGGSSPLPHPSADTAHPHPLSALPPGLPRIPSHASGVITPDSLRTTIVGTVPVSGSVNLGTYPGVGSYGGRQRFHTGFLQIGLPGAHTGHLSPPSADCRFWCKDPFGRFYCCEHFSDGGGHQGRCPPVRPNCPAFTNSFGGPQSCSSDSNCNFSDKCCFDRCLQQHVCKRAE